MRPHHVRAREGLPVTTAARAVVDLAASTGARLLGRILDDLVFDRATSRAAVGACLAQVARPGKPGVRTLARVLDDRSDEAAPCDSALEQALCAALVGAGLPQPRARMPLPGRGAVTGLVDAAYPDCPLSLGADGRRRHTRVRDLPRDHERDAEAARAGRQTLRFLYEEIIGRPGEVAATVTDVRRVRLGGAPGGNGGRS